MVDGDGNCVVRLEIFVINNWINCDCRCMCNPVLYIDKLGLGAYKCKINSYYGCLNWKPYPKIYVIMIYWQ